MKGYKLLIVDKMPQLLITGLEDIGYECDYKPDVNAEEVHDAIHDYEGLIIRSKLPVDAELIDKASKLKFIARGGSGMETIDHEYAESKGIKCINAPEGNRDAVGEHAMALLLSMLNNLPIGDKEVREGKWLREKNRGVELKGKTVGIIGFGNMGSAFAKRLKGFDVNVIAYDKQKKDFSNEFVKEVDLATIFKETDILSLHVPLTPETDYLVNDEFINKFSKNFYLINTARGKIVNTKDLTKNIESGKILGAGLDVLEIEDQSCEKLVFNGNADEEWLKYFMTCDKVVLTPHVAGLSYRSKDRIAEILVEKISTQIE